MRERSDLALIHRNHSFGAGLLCRCKANACIVGIAPALERAAYADWDVWNGDWVSYTIKALHNTCSIELTSTVGTDKDHSICAMTLYRIFLTPDVNHGDWQLFYAQLTLFTSLEALLGIINACLPLMRPVFEQLRSFIWLNADEMPTERRAHDDSTHLTQPDNDNATLASRDPPHYQSFALERWRNSDTTYTTEGEGIDAEKSRTAQDTSHLGSSDVRCGLGRP